MYFYTQYENKEDFALELVRLHQSPKDKSNVKVQKKKRKKEFKSANIILQ